MNEKLFRKARQTGFMLAAVLVTATGCVHYVDGPRHRSVYVEPRTVYAEQDDYVYYPRYRMYYGNHSHQYYYQEGPAWVARPEPRGVSARVLFSSPSVAVDFHDRPAAHHSQVIRTYPRNWKPPGGNHGDSEGRREQR